MSKSEELRKREFHDLAVKCKQFLEDHGFLVPTDTMAGHMAIFIQRERDALVSQEAEVVVSKDRDGLREKIGSELVKLFEADNNLDSYRRMIGYESQVVKSLDEVMAIIDVFVERRFRSGLRNAKD